MRRLRTNYLLFAFISWLARVLLKILCQIGFLVDKVLGLLVNVMIFSVADHRTRIGAILARMIEEAYVAENLNTRITQFLARYNRRAPSSANSALILRNSYYGKEALPEWILQDKLLGAEFIRRLGYSTPKLLSWDIPFSDIVLTENTVVKPRNMYWGRGVFIVYSAHRIVELNTKKVFGDWNSLKDYVDSLIQSKFLTGDNWMVEEFISEGNGLIPHDLKFNVFYGKVGWICVNDWNINPRHHMMDGQGTTLADGGGRFREKERFVGDGVSRVQIETIENISLKIPVPSIRMDFYLKGNELVFGEFTPVPGGTSLYNKKLDSRCGHLYHEAQARLLNDLILGKPFSEFNNFLEDIGKP